MTDKEKFEKLRSNIIMTKYDYLQYKASFFGTDHAKKIFIMSNTAPDFFRNLSEQFWERMILGVSKITDPEKQKSNENLSLAFVISLSEKLKLKCLPEMKIEYAECQNIVKNIRAYRSKILGHTDLKQIESGTMQVTLIEIEKAFLKIEDIMNLYHLEVEESTWSFDLVSAHDIGSLFYHLEQSLMYQNIKKLRNDWYKDAEEISNWNEYIRLTIAST